MVDVLDLMEQLDQEKLKNARINIEMAALKEGYFQLVMEKRDLEDRLNLYEEVAV
jgi:hypothetical protein